MYRMARKGEREPADGPPHARGSKKTLEARFDLNFEKGATVDRAAASGLAWHYTRYAADANAKT